MGIEQITKSHFSLHCTTAVEEKWRNQYTRLSISNFRFHVLYIAHHPILSHASHPPHDRDIYFRCWVFAFYSTSLIYFLRIYPVLVSCPVTCLSLSADIVQPNKQPICFFVRLYDGLLRHIWICDVVPAKQYILFTFSWSRYAQRNKYLRIPSS